jgi:hypothetical protein
MSIRKKKFELSPRLKLGVGRARSQNKILKLASVLCLVLAVGLGFYAFRLALKEKGTQVLDAATPQVLGASDIKSDSAADQVKFIEYKIQKGDTLFNVSQKFNISWTTLSTLNDLKSPFTLKPGQIIKIPK